MGIIEGITDGPPSCHFVCEADLVPYIIVQVSYFRESVRDDHQLTRRTPRLC